MNNSINRVGIVFSGGPAPAANAVISAVALSFLDLDVEVVGFTDGWEHLQQFSSDNPLREGTDYRFLTRDDVSHIRSDGAIILRTSRCDPGDLIHAPEDLQNPEHNFKLLNILFALESLEIDALITIGGDGTLGSAYYLQQVQELVLEPGHVRFIHLPKSIDNDYFGADFTFGFMTAADQLSREVRDIRADAQSSSSWYVLELMGRQSGWLTYAAGIAGAATKMYSVEDFQDGFDLQKTAEEIVGLMLLREQYGRRYGVICVAEGLAELLPPEMSPDVDHLGNISLGTAEVGRTLAKSIEGAYLKSTGNKIKVRSKQLGYEVRCSEPNAFDILLGSQLGAGACRALLEEDLDAVMVSVEGQLQLRYVPFTELVDTDTLKTRVRFIDPKSDFYRLARTLEDRKRMNRGDQD